MKASIKIYSKFNQSKKVDGLDERVKTVATKVNETLSYELNPKLNKAKQLSAVTSFVSQAIGARYKAVIAAGKKLPAKLYFEISIDNEVYRSETALLKANFTNLVTVSLAGLKKINANEIIQTVASTQTTALKVASNYLNDLKVIAASVDAEMFDGTEFTGMQVEPSGELAEA